MFSLSTQMLVDIRNKDLNYCSNASETFERQLKPGAVAQTYNPRIQEAETGGWHVQGQPWLYSNILSNKPQLNEV